MKSTLTIAISLLFAGQIFAINHQPVVLESAYSFIDSSEWNSIPGNHTDKSIKTANKNGKIVFLVVFDKSGAAKDNALSIAKTASTRRKSLSEVVELNITDNDNRNLLKKYGLSGAPLPLILVLDKNGTAVSGFPPGSATVDELVEKIPSSKSSEIMKGLTEKKSVFVVAFKKSMTQKSVAIANCNEAAKSMNDGAIVIELNIEDKEETTLLQNLKVDLSANEPVIYAINKTGQVVGTFPFETSSKQLVLAAIKLPSTSCGPNGCAPGSSCTPAKK